MCADGPFLAEERCARGRAEGVRPGLGGRALLVGGAVRDLLMGSRNVKDVDIDKIAEKTVKETLDQFGSKPCASGKYRAVFSPDATASLLAPYLNNLSSEQVQKNS